MTTDTLDEIITDLPKEISALLAKAGVASPEEWKSNLKEEALTSDDIDIQRFLINRTWRQILCSGPATTMDTTRDARSALIDSPVRPKDYLRFFEELIIPCALRHNLLPTTH
jgi:hypothetical protein